MISDIEKCTACGVCLDNCYVDARVLQGEDYTVDELMAILAKDETYYRKSGGGITFSGGEPLIYSSFIKACCGRIHDMGATVLIETCGEVETSHLEEILDCVDIIYCDFKHFDTEKHRLYTGRGNERIIENIKLMNEKFKGELSLRYPYIPGCNDEPEAIEAFLSFAEGLDKVKEVVFLPYHRLGLDKYNGLGRVYAMGDMPSLKIKDLDHLKAYEKTFNLKIKVM